MIYDLITIDNLPKPGDMFCRIGVSNKNVSVRIMTGNCQTRKTLHDLHRSGNLFAFICFPHIITSIYRKPRYIPLGASTWFPSTDVLFGPPGMLDFVVPLDLNNAKNMSEQHTNNAEWLFIMRSNIDDKVVRNLDIGDEKDIFQIAERIFESGIHEI